MPLSSFTISCLSTFEVRCNTYLSELDYYYFSFVIHLKADVSVFFLKLGAKCVFLVWCSPSVTTVTSARDWSVSTFLNL